MATNILLNPSFEVDSNADGLANSWASTVSNSTNTASIVSPGRFGLVAQKIRAVHISGANGFPNLTQLTAVGSFAPGEAASLSLWYRNLSKVGAGPVYAVITARNAAQSLISEVQTALTVVSAEWTLARVSCPTLPALTSLVGVKVTQAQTADGDLFEVEVDGMMLAKAPSAPAFGSRVGALMAIRII